MLTQLLHIHQILQDIGSGAVETMITNRVAADQQVLNLVGI